VSAQRCKYFCSISGTHYIKLSRDRIHFRYRNGAGNSRAICSTKLEVSGHRLVRSSWIYWYVQVESLRPKIVRCGG